MDNKLDYTKEEGLKELKALIEAFQKNIHALKSPQYNEAQLRNDYLNPMLKAFGWDLDNRAAKSQSLREVIQEESIEVEEDDTSTKKKPDYTMRIYGERKFFVEAKRVSVDIVNSIPASFQTRRYGWSAKLGLSILTNFEHIAVYDCRSKPEVTDSSHVARYQIFHFTQFVDRFDELYQLLSYESVASGKLDDYFAHSQVDAIAFDEYFLQQIEGWREKIAQEIIQNNDGFNEEAINFLVQRLLNRIVFLRICEDREIEKYETLKLIKNYDQLKALFVESDKKYNSGLFDFIEDNFSLAITFKAEALLEIFQQLYYPESPYDFAVVEPEILSQIYERYLGSKIAIVEDRKIQIVAEPEVAASSGVVPTPKQVVRCIVHETLEPLFEGKSVDEIQNLKIADICCGSGTFLISTFDFIHTFLVEEILKIDENSRLLDKSIGFYRLTLKAKQDILLNNIFGVDINPYAVEVSKFSLLLKLLENETRATLDDHMEKHHEKLLPSLDKNIKCGNSLVDEDFFSFDSSALQNDELLFKLKPFEWSKEFDFFTTKNGFDAIVGNPPYIRIQNIVKYSKEEVKYYQNKASGYTVAKSDSFDKYYLFLQRAVELINDNGVVGYIVPHKFFLIKGGKALREFLTSKGSLFKIIHFGVIQIFPGRSTYTAILIVDKKSREQLFFKKIRSVAFELTSDSINYDSYQSSRFKEAPWVFVSKETEGIFNRINNGNVVHLKKIADIAVGLQTSADDVYIFKSIAETETTLKFENQGEIIEVEKAICKPSIYNLSFNLFDTIKPNSWIIFPYTINDDKAEVISEEAFQETYPLAWNYLNKFKSKLSRRSINGSKNPKWYQFGRSQSLTRFHNTPKLIWPVLSLQPSYIFDDTDIQFTGGGNGPYYSLISIAGYSPLFILGVLTHPILEAMIKSQASEFRGAYYSHGKQFMEELPIPFIDFENVEQTKLHDEIVATVQQLIQSRTAYLNENVLSNKSVLLRKIDMLLNSLFAQVSLFYGIGPNDIEIVKSDEMLFNNLLEETV